jgi:hypothetical protein
MKHPATWTRSDLHLHLQHALALEIWTIPLYLTALYSIKGLRGVKPHSYPDAAKLLYSIAVQEMLHIELVCNISNALGWTPRFHRPTYSNRVAVPFIHPRNEYLPEMLHGYPVIPGGLNENSLHLFCAIELPHPKKENSWEAERSYDSISEMYDALRIGIEVLWDECYIGDDLNTRQKYGFREYHNTGGRQHGFSQPVFSKESALKAIEAIVEQGEGATTLTVPVDYRPPGHTEDLDHDAGWFKGHLSHYQKFLFLLHRKHSIPPIYEVTNDVSDSIEQRSMQESFVRLIEEMELSFSQDGDELSIPFWEKMYAFVNGLIDVWESGSCPRFDW